jgi:hypothetical protein
VYASPWLMIRQARKSLPIHQGPHVWKMSHDGLAIQSPHSGTSVGWALLREVYETDEFFFFYLTRQAAYILPKRVVSPDDLANVRRGAELWCAPSCVLPRGWARVSGGAA